MKIINSKIFQVIYYYYYLLQYKINGGLADFMALGMISFFLFPLISGLLIVIFTLIYKYWIGLILAFFIYLYIDHYLFKTVYDTGLIKKIIRKKPKILNNHFLSILFVIAFTVCCFFLSIWGGIILSKKIEEMGICLIK